jgi:gamma-glutamylcyclotransferase
VKPPGAPTLYFAYGANVHPRWLARRVPAAELLGPGALPGFRLAFRKLGRDGAGRSDACAAGNSAVALPGALYRLAPEELARLGAAGAGYHLETVSIETGAGPVEAVTWLADPAAVAEGLLPWDWYVGLILAGAERLGLPEDHRRWLAAVPRQHDPDVERAAPARRILAGEN